MNAIKLLTVVLVTLNMSACTWVKLEPAGETVKILTATEVADCKRVGKTTVKTASKLAGLERHDYKVQDELETLARNSAIDLGGDAVIAIGTPVDGRQLFEVYRCMPD